MCIELREKVSNFETHEISGASNEAKLALESLGYSSKDIQAALASIAPKDTDDINTIIKQALKYLG
jgi:Holliday junction resolvasome RuvABC DNA-binding subunit